MTATPTPSPLFQGIHPDTGAPLSGGKVWTYEAGTTTPADTWADADQAGVNPNPVILDAAGQAPIYIEGAYKFRVTDSADNLLYTIDDVLGGSDLFIRPASGVTSLPFDDIASTNVQAALEELGTKRLKANDPLAIVDLISSYLLQAGAIMAFHRRQAPPGWFECNGQAIARASYPELFAAITRQATVTITIASPAVISWTGHLLQIGDPVRFTTTGALPTGLSAGTTYYVISAGHTANSFRVSTSIGGAAVNTSGTQSGVHTALNAPSGYGDGSTTFNVPDLRGEFIRGWDVIRGVDNNRTLASSQAEMIGPHAHTGSTGTDTPAHTHTVDNGGSRHGASGATPATWYGGDGDTVSNSTVRSVNTNNPNSLHSHPFTTNSNAGTENRPRNVAFMYCICTGGTL